MGVAIAAAAWRRGANVTLVAGPLDVPPPEGVTVVHVETTEQMARAVAQALPRAAALVMAAAPADFGVALPASSKVKKSTRPAQLTLTPTVDILESTRERRREGAVIVGFALETDDLLSNARAKLEAKALDLVVVNDAREPGAAFAVDTNRVTLVDAAGGVEDLPLMTKAELADLLLDRVEARLRGC